MKRRHSEESDAVLDSGLFQEKFAPLVRKHKVQVLCDLVDLCSPQEKLDFQEELRSHLSRDFLGLLPPEIAVKILEYLDVEDLVQGLQVCKNWRQLITEATPVWKDATKKLGIGQSVVDEKLPKYSSLPALVLAAYKHRKCISSMIPNIVPAVVPITCHRHQTYHWGYGIVVRSSLATDDSDTFDLDVLSLQHPLSLTLLYSVCDVSRYLLPLWVSVVRNEGVVWRNIAGSHWVAVTNVPHAPTIARWRDQGMALEEVADVCDKCGVISLLPPTVASETLRLCFLTRQLRSLQRISCQLKLPDGPYTSPEHDSYEIEDVHIFSTSSEKESGTCILHCILIQFRGSILIYHIGTPTSGMYHPTRVLCPQNKVEGMFFQRSENGKLVSVVDSQSCQHCIWVIDTGICHLVDTPPSCCACLALGHLYSILQCEDSVKVVATYTGEVLFNCKFSFARILSRGDLPYPRFWVPMNSVWLSDFECYELDIWHILLVNTGLEKNALRSIVGLCR